MSARTGIIGGSGLYEINGLDIIDKLRPQTPFGEPSDDIVLARMHGHEVAFLSRHGLGHRLPPHKINYRANVYAMKLAGVKQIISISAVGSLRECIAPGDFVLVDQFVDQTHDRPSTFFDGPVVAHVSMADPVCHRLQKRLLSACQGLDIQIHPGGVYLAMQGPQFSSRAESELYRSWGMDVIGMTNMPEAKLAREAELCYATVAMSTDYDCWHQEEEAVNVTAILEVMRNNVSNAIKMLSIFFEHAPAEADTCSCGCNHALEQAILTDLSQQNDSALRPIHAMVERFL